MDQTIHDLKERLPQAWRALLRCWIMPQALGMCLQTRRIPIRQTAFRQLIDVDILLPAAVFFPLFLQLLGIVF